MDKICVVIDCSELAVVKGRCLPCKRQYERDYRNANKDKFTCRILNRAYGITLAEYDSMLEAQHNACALCSKSPEDNGKRLAVDHCHDTLRVRGLLCDSCNRGIGLLKDDVDLLERAINYLRSKYG